MFDAKRNLLLLVYITHSSPLSQAKFNDIIILSFVTNNINQHFKCKNPYKFPIYYISVLKCFIFFFWFSYYLNNNKTYRQDVCNVNTVVLNNILQCRIVA